MYAQYVAWAGGEPTQKKYLNPKCKADAPGQITVPNFTPTYAKQKAPYGRRDITGKQFVILARSDRDYISALGVALHLKRERSNTIMSPVITADTYFACDSMKTANTSRNVCVIVLGDAAKQDVNIVFPTAYSYSSYSAWAAGRADGYINAATSSDHATNWRKARDEGLAAYDAGF